MTTPTATRALAALAAVACALSLAACGGTDSKAGGDRPAGDDAQAAALKFSRCMRDNGVDMPDPQPSGSGAGSGSEVPFDHIDPSDPGFKRAERACAKHLKGGLGVQPTKSGLKKPGQDPKADEALLRIARCMREEGIDFPDPKNGAITIDEDSGSHPSDPAFQEAQKKCRLEAPLAPAGG